MRLTLLLALMAVACGPKPTLHVDSGPDDDGGVDAGVDAGRVRGDDPPNGWQVALPLSLDAGASTRVGVSTSMVLDAFGQPMLAAIIVDPNADAVLQDNRLVFTRWDGVAKAWQAPVTIEVIGDIDVTHPNRQVSLARNPTTGLIGVAYLNESGVVRLGTSDDEGLHFSLETVSETVTDGSKLSNPALAMVGNTVHVAYNARPTCAPGMCGRLLHRTRVGAAAFTTDEVQGSLKAREWPFAMALDSSGTAAFAYFSDDGVQTTLSYVNGGSTQFVHDSIATFDTMVKTPSVSLSLAGDLPRVAFHMVQVVNTDAELHYAQKTGGTWSPAVVLSRNGPATMLDSTRWYQALVPDMTNRVTVVANFARAGAVGQMCGGPKLYRSTDGVAWPMPCHPPETGGPTVHAISQGGLWLNVAAHKPGKVTIALDYEERFNPTIGPGVLVYREP